MLLNSDKNMTPDEVRLAELLGLKYDDVGKETLELIRWSLSKFSFNGAYWHCKAILKC